MYCPSHSGCSAQEVIIKLLFHFDLVTSTVFVEKRRYSIIKHLDSENHAIVHGFAENDHK